MNKLSFDQQFVLGAYLTQEASRYVEEGFTYNEVAEEVMERQILNGTTVTGNNVAGVARALKLKWNGRQGKMSDASRARAAAKRSEIARKKREAALQGDAKAIKEIARYLRKLSAELGVDFPETLKEIAE